MQDYILSDNAAKVLGRSMVPFANKVGEASITLTSGTVEKKPIYEAGYEWSVVINGELIRGRVACHVDGVGLLPQAFKSAGEAVKQFLDSVPLVNTPIATDLPNGGRKVETTIPAAPSRSTAPASPAPAAAQSAAPAAAPQEEPRRRGRPPGSRNAPPAPAATPPAAPAPAPEEPDETGPEGDQPPDDNEPTGPSGRSIRHLESIKCVYESTKTINKTLGELPQTTIDWFASSDKFPQTKPEYVQLREDCIELNQLRKFLGR